MPLWGLSVFFCGQYHHQLDDKGRLRIPPAFRKLLGDSPVIFCDDGCLQIYTAEDFAAKIKSRFDNADVFDKEMNKRKRRIFPSMQPVKEDKQGRVGINGSFIKDCKMKKDIITVGVLDHVEVWGEEYYDAYINDREYVEDGDAEVEPSAIDEKADESGDIEENEEDKGE